MRNLRHRRRNKGTQCQVGKAGFEPRSPDSQFQKTTQAAALISPSCCPTMCQQEGKMEERSCSPGGPSSQSAGWRLSRRNSSGWLVLMLEECLEKSCLSPLYLTHHLPVSRSVREELP